MNLRKSFDGLAGAVQEYIGRDPASGHLFVFFSRNKKLVKMLFYQDGGMCIFAKRLERGQFNLPVSAEGKIVVHVSLESKNSLDLNTVRNNVKMVRF